MQSNITISLSIYRGNIRQAATLLLLAALLMSLSLSAGATERDWARFKHDFIESSGRVVDPAQDNISHSEGQGFAMLLAVHYGDQASFEQVWQWTRQHLQIRDDHLLAWRWAPQSGITDKNNASDGDLLVAWSLLRAFEKWHSAEYFDASQKISRDIRTKLLRKTPHGIILLPGIEGFDKAEGITINLSYWVFPALAELGRADPAPEWDALANTGISILQYARFGRWGLPPDWLLLNDKVAPSGEPARFGYNALRTPLYLLWSRRESKSLLQPYQDFWKYFDGARFLPAWTNLHDDSVDSHDASAGIHRVAQWTLHFGSHKASHKLVLHGSGVGTQEGYYSSVLLLLTEMAMQERAAR